MGFQKFDEKKSARVVVWACVLSGITFMLVGIPLALNLVPSNPVYGIRVAASLASEHNWTFMNITGGITLILTGLVLTSLGLISLKHVGPLSTKKSRQSAFMSCFMAILFAPGILILAVAISTRFLK
jgi:hypothetical protein